MLIEPEATTLPLSLSAGPRDVPLLELDHRRGPAPHASSASATARRSSCASRATAPPTASCGSEVGLAARGLLARGVRKGDRVGIWAPNRYEWVVTQYATARIGAILVTINPAYKAAELEYALNKTGVSLLVLARGFRQADYVAMVGEVRARCAALRETLVLEDDWEPLLADGERRPEADLAAVEATLRPDEPINVQFTSGTTGAPKGATLSHRNILNNGYFTGLTLRYNEHDRVCVPVPFYHCFGMVRRPTWPASTHGACVVVPGANFDPLATLRGRRGRGCTALYGVPTMFIAELEHPRFAELRPLEPAHGDHGRRAVPGRGHERASARGCTWTRSPSPAA